MEVGIEDDMPLSSSSWQGSVGQKGVNFLLRLVMLGKRDGKLGGFDRCNFLVLVFHVKSERAHLKVVFFVIEPKETTE